MKRTKPLFIDLFAGCGGLSLGLFEAGWQGVFAVERDPRAFATLNHNLMGRKHHTFKWPEWLPRTALDLKELLENRTLIGHLRELKTGVDLLAGGPPCQGFSMLGKRRFNDPRNQLFRQYLEFVRMLRPKLVLIENVQGICHAFRNAPPSLEAAEITNYAELITSELSHLGYEVIPGLVFAAKYGVPQIRPRFFLVAADKGNLSGALLDPFEILETNRVDFLRRKELNPDAPVTARQAIGDLVTEGQPLECSPDNARFNHGRYGAQRSAYQRLMHGELNGALADSHRLANHRPETVEKFKWFLKSFEPGTKIHPNDRGAFFTKKHTIQILHPDKPAPTITTLPDDLLHYNEPRILSVRETARLQSFPDWFEFKGKYTTGGKERVKECPRYTQVGNAVPPLLAEALGRALLTIRREALIE